MGTGENTGENTGSNTGSSGSSLARPTAPTIVSFGSATTSTLTLTWSYNDSYTMDATYVYLLQGGVQQGVYTKLGTATSHTFTGLTSGTTYGAYVTTENGERISDASITTYQPTKDEAGGFIPNITDMDFESLSAGQQITDSSVHDGTIFNGIGSGATPFWETGQAFTNVEETDVKTGTRSGIIYVVRPDEPQGSGYEPDMGVKINFLPMNKVLVKGDELWERFDIKLPANFNPQTTGGGLKFVFQHRRNASGDNNGRCGVWIYNSLHNNQIGYRCVNEFDTSGYTPQAFLPTGHPDLVKTDQDYTVIPTGAEWNLDEWVSFEYYCYLSDDLTEAVQRFWVNNVLVGEITNMKTLITASGDMDEVKIFPYWNGADGSTSYPRFGPSINDSPNEPAKILIDNVKTTNQDARPTNADASGNTYIGDVGGGT